MEKGTMKISRICEKILAAADLENMAGLAVGIMAGGEICTGTRGYRNIENGELMDADTIFHCASISKTFTSTAVMKLVEEGKLRLDDKLVDVLPYLSIADKRCQKIEINHMLSHISGLQDAGELGWKAGLTGADALKNYAFANEVTDRPMLGEPGNCTPMYSDMAYDLLGLVIQEVSGQPFETYIKENFFDPAGMKDTTFLTFERTGGSLSLNDIDKAKIAMPHVKDADGKIVLESMFPYTRQHAPSSTLTSNVSDLLKWGRYNLDKKAVSADSYEKMWTERVNIPDKFAMMGMGWFIRHENGHMFVGHEGGDDGFRTSFWTCPECDAALVILANTTEAPIEPLTESFCMDIE